MENRQSPGVIAGRSVHMDTSAYDSFASLFPMRMTSIEKFHFWDDDPELPNLIYCRLRFDSKLDPVVAKQAWQIAIQRQPFGDVEPKKINGRWFWTAGPRKQGVPNRDIDNWNGTRFEFQLLATAPPEWEIDQHRIRSSTGSYLGITAWPVVPQPPVDLPTAVPGGVMSSAGRESDLFASEAWFYVHHAISDGAAAAQVVNEWMVIYANLISGRVPESGIHRLDSNLFRKRNTLGLLSWRYLKHLPKQPIALFGAAKFSFRNTVELIPSGNYGMEKELAESNPRHFPAILGQWVCESNVNLLVQQAAQHEVMLNSVLLGHLYLALTRWRREQGFHSERDWIRVILPMSIRNVSDRRLPASNRATIVQIDRCEREMRDLGRFYRNLNREIQIIRGFQLDKMFLIAIRGLSIFETFLKRAARHEKSRGTVVFTNLGEPLRKSERVSSREPDSQAFVRPTEFDPVGPIRKGTPVNFSASRHGPRLRISMHYDANVLSRTQATGLLETYLDQLGSIG